MSAQDLSFSELTHATAPFVSGDFAAWWRSTDVGRLSVARFDGLRSMVAEAPSESSEIGRLTTALGEEDVDHDRAVRFGHGFLDNYAQHHDVASVRELALALIALFFPDGVALVNKSYEEEAGRTAARDAALTPEVRAQLALFKLVEWEGAPLTLEQWIDTVLQASSRRLAALVAERRSFALDPDAPSGTDLLNAKRAIIAIVNQTFATFALVEDQLEPTTRALLQSARDHWNAEVKAATDRAAARRRARKGLPPVTPVTPTT